VTVRGKDLPSPSEVPEVPDSAAAAVGPEPEDNRPSALSFPVVGIGASAGGLEAFTELLEALPANTGMAFVLVQHLDPDHASLLTALLARATAMPVEEVRDGVRVLPNCVYVIPPNTRLTLGDGALRLAPRLAHSPQLPIDSFFFSLSDEQQRLAIGIILSGTGSDGAEGIRAIKARCGITFAQDDESAHFRGMPQTARGTGAVDYVLTPAEIARELVHIGQHRYVVGGGDVDTAEVLPEGQSEIQGIYQLVERATHVDFAFYKQTTVRRRIGRRMIVNRCEQVGDYLALLQRNADEIQELYRDILICVTSFFRDPAAFQALRPHLERMVSGVAEGDSLRVWVAGCSTGEELYSLAICLHEIIDQQGRETGLQLFGTDISEAALTRARTGVYSENILQTVSAERLRRFFHKVDGGYQINQAIRDTCIFAKQDVTRDPPFSRLNLISCRNVLIYLGAALQKTVFGLFHYALNAGGLLFLGSAETAAATPELFQVVDGQHKLFTRNSSPARLPAPFSSFRGVPETSVAVRIERTLSASELQKRADRAIQNRYAPDGVVIDAGMQILQYRGRTGFYLEPAQGEASHHLLRMAHESLQPVLRRSVAAAIQTNTVVQQKGLRIEHLGEMREVTLEVVPISGLSPNERYYMVMFERESVAASERPSGFPAASEQPAFPPPEAVADRIERLERELADAREYLRSQREDHETAIEELRAANEEVGSANEELQSTNEQLGTAKEELQSTNEELITVNDELKARNDELGVLTNDLNNVLSAADLPVLMVDRTVRLRRFTPKAERWLHLIPSDTGRLLSEIQDRVPLPELATLVAKVIDTLAMETREVQDGDGLWWLLTIHPYRTSEHRIEGAVLVFVDIDLLHRNLQETQEARDFADAIVNTVHEPLLVLTPDLRVQRANPSFYRTFQVSRDETQGRFLHDLGNGQWDIKALRQALEQVLSQRAGFADLEVVHAFPKIGTRTIWLNGCGIATEDEPARAILLALEDVTLRRQAEQALKRSNADLEQFAYLASHDLREPLRTIGSFSELLAKRYKGKLDAEADEFIGFVLAAVARMNRLITDLLAYSRVANSEVNPGANTSAHAALQETLWNLRAAIDSSGASITHGDLPLVPFDSLQLSLLFLNLIGNAIKYRRSDVPPQIHVAAEPGAAEWTFSVRDNGIGFAQASAEVVFAVFKRLHGREYDGTGIGLAICKRIVERHHGRIWAESEIGVGSTFWFTVPSSFPAA
jgi:two-component system, chemotaxis family, CheB/CheR fusion protein